METICLWELVVFIPLDTMIGTWKQKVLLKEVSKISLARGKDFWSILLLTF